MFGFYVATKKKLVLEGGSMLGQGPLWNYYIIIGHYAFSILTSFRCT